MGASISDFFVSVIPILILRQDEFSHTGDESHLVHKPGCYIGQKPLGATQIREVDKPQHEMLNPEVDIGLKLFLDVGRRSVHDEAVTADGRRLSAIRGDVEIEPRGFLD